MPKTMGRPKKERHEHDDGKAHECWFFTWSNYDDSVEKMLQDFEKKYLVYGREICPTTNTPHLQGYIIMTRKYRFDAFRKLMSNRHVKPACTNDAMNYCMKDRDYYIEDNRKQGQRTDLLAVSKMIIDERQNLRSVALARPREFIKYHAGIEKLINHAQDRITGYTPTEVIVIIGTPGKGKSRLAREIDEHLFEVPHIAKGKLWMDGYAGHKTILFDDYEGEMPFRQLLKICDVYPMQEAIKGGFVHRNWNRVIFTTNKEIEDWYPHLYFDEENENPFLRRISRIVRL